MTDSELNELFERVLSRADRQTILLVGELHKRLALAKLENAEAWSAGYQDGWSDRAHPGEDRVRNPYRYAESNLNHGAYDE